MFDLYQSLNVNTESKTPDYKNRRTDAVPPVDAGLEFLTCPGCGQPCNIADTVCARCGSDLTSEDTDQTELRPDAIEPASCPKCGRTQQPGELICSNCGFALHNWLRTRKRQSVVMKRECPKCGSIHRAEDRVCMVCGNFLQPDAVLYEDTCDFHNQFGDKLGDEPQPTGNAITGDQNPIVLEIDGTHLMLPPGKVITIGRRSSKGTDDQPNVDLSAFDAHAKGVSRCHIRIKRQGTLVYVADIGSTNGTWLNGQRLILHGERLLRSGDELQLSHLKIRVLYRL